MKFLSNKRPLHMWSISILLMLLIPTPLAIAAEPIISTTWTVANGASTPTLVIVGFGFDPANDKFDFTVDVGTTGLAYDSVAFVDSTHMRFTFHKIAKAGIITIQANSSAFLPVATSASNTISIVVPVPLTPQSISFTTPTAMTVKSLDQIPKVTATSGLSVLLSSNTPSVCTIDFLKIHAVAAGTCSITATQIGNSIVAPALAVTKNFTISALPSVTPIPTSKPEDVVSNLGSASYDPKNANTTYVSVLVADETADPKTVTLVKLFIPAGATQAPVVFLISAFSSPAETTAGYFVARIKSSTAQGTSISRFKKSIEINIPAGAKNGIPFWSFDGLIWHKLKQIETEVMPSNLHLGYFVEKDGRVAIFTDYLMLFGFRQNQAILAISPLPLTIKPKIQTQLVSTGGSGHGSVTFFSRTSTVCSITPSGLLVGKLEGKCTVTARKASSGIFADAISSSVSVFIQHESIAPGHPADDPNHSTLCQEISYSLLKSSTLIFVNLCPKDAKETATLVVGTKLKSGKWSYKVVAKQNLGSEGVTVFKLNSVLKIGQIVRVMAEGKLQIAVTIKGK